MIQAMRHRENVQRWWRRSGDASRGDGDSHCGRIGTRDDNGAASQVHGPHSGECDSGRLCFTRSRQRNGASLLEVLIVVGIILLLLQLLLPAVNAARASARRMICVSKIRELASAMTLHHDALGHFPSGGWHYTWIGEPERGTGRDQPGSWAFNLLDYLQHGSLRSLGRGVDDGRQGSRGSQVGAVRHCASSFARNVAT